MALVQHSLNELSNETKTAPSRQSLILNLAHFPSKHDGPTHESLHLRPIHNTLLHAHQVPQHPSHQILPTNHNLLIKVLQPRRIADEPRVRDSSLEFLDERVGDGWTGEGGGGPRIVRAWDEDKVGSSEEGGEGG